MWLFIPVLGQNSSILMLCKLGWSDVSLTGYSQPVSVGGGESDAASKSNAMLNGLKGLHEDTMSTSDFIATYDNRSGRK